MIDLFLQFNSVLVAVFGVTIVGVISTGVNTWIKRQNSFNLRLTNLEESNIAILHDKIYKYCQEFIGKGFVTVGDLDNLEYLFKSYKVLGGNGTGDTLYNKVKELEIRKEGI